MADVRVGEGRRSRMIDQQAQPRGPTDRPTRTPRRVAVMPAYNEEATVVAVLERLEPLADEIIVVDDGSTDRTRELILGWADPRPNVRLICFNENRGMSAAYYRAFQEIGRRVTTGQLSPDDVILTVDADGQHDPEEVDALVARLVDNKLDAVIARRDFSNYTLYKRIGNWIMSAWATIWAGQRLYDVESGYRAFRVGALLSALRFYKGYKYSETVEVAVILPHLGYRVDNNFLVPIPIFRSRTRLKDVVIDLAAMVGAWWRVMSRRGKPRDVSSKLAYGLAALGPLALVLMAANLLVHSLFLGNDSMQTYSHVYYLSQQLFQHGHLPLHVSLLDNGRAVTFPYAFVPYLMGAGLYHFVGDWAVTLLFALAVVGVVIAAGLARPITRDPWFLLLFVINPFFVDAVYSFQFATIWSALFFFIFVWSFERRRYWLAAPLLWLCVSSHPIVGGLAAGVYGLSVIRSHREQVRPLLLIAAPVGLALAPIYWMALQTPAVSENSVVTLALSVLDAVTRRGTIFLLPFVFPYAATFVRRNYRFAVAGFASALVLGLLWSNGAFHVGDMNRGTYYGAVHTSTNVYADYFQSPAFQPGATYRVLEPKGREDGMYRFMKKGAVLSDEFFSESQMRRNWQEAQYGCYTAYEGIDYVVMESAYQRVYHKNEASLIEHLISDGQARVSYADPAGRFTVYDIRAFSLAQPRPASLKDCRLY